MTAADLRPSEGGQFEALYEKVLVVSASLAMSLPKQR